MTSGCNKRWHGDHDAKSKTKRITVSGKKRNLPKPVPLTFYGKELPWLSSTLTWVMSYMDHDITLKRAEFINCSCWNCPVFLCFDIEPFHGGVSSCEHCWQRCKDKHWNQPSSDQRCDWSWPLELFQNIGEEVTRWKDVTGTWAKHPEHRGSLSWRSC